MFAFLRPGGGVGLPCVSVQWMHQWVVAVASGEAGEARSQQYLDCRAPRPAQSHACCSQPHLPEVFRGATVPCLCLLCRSEPPLSLSVRLALPTTSPARATSQDTWGGDDVRATTGVSRGALQRRLSFSTNLECWGERQIWVVVAALSRWGWTAFPRRGPL